MSKKDTEKKLKQFSVKGIKEVFNGSNRVFLCEMIDESSEKKILSIYKKRQKLKEIIMNKKLPLEERFKAQQKLSKLPRNSAKNRVMNRCQITGRPHAVYRRFGLSRNKLRELAMRGDVPGLVKSSW